MQWPIIVAGAAASLLTVLLVAISIQMLLPSPALGRDMDCGDFGSQAEAQAYFEGRGGSPANNVDRLDGNHDGIACDGHDYSQPAQPTAPTAPPPSEPPAAQEDRTTYDQPDPVATPQPTETPSEPGGISKHDATGLTALVAGGAAALVAAWQRRSRRPPRD